MNLAVTGVGDSWGDISEVVRAMAMTLIERELPGSTAASRRSAETSLVTGRGRALHCTGSRDVCNPHRTAALDRNSRIETLFLQLI